MLISVPSNLDACGLSGQPREQRSIAGKAKGNWYADSTNCERKPEIFVSIRTHKVGKLYQTSAVQPLGSLLYS